MLRNLDTSSLPKCLARGQLSSAARRTVVIDSGPGFEDTPERTRDLAPAPGAGRLGTGRSRYRQDAGLHRVRQVGSLFDHAQQVEEDSDCCIRCAVFRMCLFLEVFVGLQRTLDHQVRWFEFLRGHSRGRSATTLVAGIEERRTWFTTSLSLCIGYVAPSEEKWNEAPHAWLL